MNCEGMARWNGRIRLASAFPAKSRQAQTIPGARTGQGHRQAVALKGRLGSNAESYQIVRLETDMIAPLPECRLVADRPASNTVRHFRRKRQNWGHVASISAEVYPIGGGRRFHRRHSFQQLTALSGGRRKAAISVRSLLKRSLKSSTMKRWRESRTLG